MTVHSLKLRSAGSRTGWGEAQCVRPDSRSVQRPVPRLDRKSAYPMGRHARHGTLQLIFVVSARDSSQRE